MEQLAKFEVLTDEELQAVIGGNAFTGFSLNYLSSNLGYGAGNGFDRGYY